MKHCNKILLFLTIYFFALVVSSCTMTNNEKINYYSNEQNYVKITGTINHIVFDEEQEVLYLGFTNLSKETDDNCFKVVGDSYSVVVANKDFIQSGKTATFVTAPKYYGNGYVIPIVSLTIDDNNILEYEVGFWNLLQWLQK